MFPLFVSASNMDQEFFIQSNGDVIVKSNVSLDGTYNGFEFIIKYAYDNK